MLAWTLTLHSLVLTDGTDYKARVCQLTFDSGSTAGDTSCVDIVIIDDDVKEANESFIFALCAGGDDDVHIDDFHADVHIWDDDSMS